VRTHSLSMASSAASAAAAAASSAASCESVKAARARARVAASAAEARSERAISRSIDDCGEGMPGSCATNSVMGSSGPGAASGADGGRETHLDPDRRVHGHRDV